MAAPTKKQVKTVPVIKPALFPFSYKIKCQILIIIGFVFYMNSTANRYAMDDSITIERNSFVQMGIAGIPKILTTDSYYSFYKNMGGDPSQQLKGGRYRPLSEMIFAVEHTLFGWLDNSTGKGSQEETTFNLAHVMHFINVIGYIMCLLSLLYFLDKFLLNKLPGGSDCAFLATLLFAIHPLHTEVVANIKSLDEILSLTLIMLTFIFSLKYLREKKRKQLWFGCGSFLLALLAKEYALTLVFFIPLLFYLLDKKKPFEAMTASLPYFGVVLIYIVLRLNAVGFHNKVIGTSDILSNPYLYATPIQKLATEWFVLGKYIKLLFIPYPLSADYSYYQIKYHSFSDVTVLLSLLIYMAIFYWGILLLRRKNILSFAVFFFLMNVFMISNLAIDIGATMGERLMFHPSLGFVIIISFFFLKALSKVEFQKKKMIVFGVASVLSVVCLGETVVRNTQWMDDTSLFIHDVSVVPNSCLANNNAAYGYVTRCEDDYKVHNDVQANQYLDSALKYSKAALVFNKKYVATYLNLGAIYFHKQDLDSAMYCWNMVGELYPNHPSLKSKYTLLSQYYLIRGLDMGRSGNLRAGISNMEKALIATDSLVGQLNHNIGESGSVIKDMNYKSSIDSTYAQIWYNIGGAYFTKQQYDSARYAWMKALQYKPGDEDAKRGLSALQQNK
jgi:protein O-mannosyl-transferase